MVQLKPDAGDQEKVPLPAPLNVVLSPAHTDTSGPALAVGKGLTVTVCMAVPVHPFPSVPVTE